MAQFDSQQPIYDGSENIPGQAYAFESTNGLDQAIAEGYLPVVDRVFPPQIMAQFLESLAWKLMPGNTTTTLPLPDADALFTYLSQPYSDWAPPPFNTLEGSPASRVQTRIASHEDTTGLQVVDKPVAATKTRLWEDVMPLSRNQWRRKRLSEPEQFDQAVQYLGAAVDAFAYLNVESVQDSLAGVFDGISEEWGKLEGGLGALQGTSEGHGSLAKLWEEYVRKRWAIMTTRTHDWVLQYVNELRGRLIEQLREHEPESLDALSTEQWNVTNKLHLLAEIAGRAGFTILLPMHGYKDHEATESFSPHIDTRREVYGMDLMLRSRVKGWSRVNEGASGEQNASQKVFRGPADPESLVEGILDQKAAQEELRVELVGREIVPLVAEEWILKMKREMDQEEYGSDKWGFVVYRITHEQSEKEWKEFLQRLQADMDDWGDGVKGADLIRDTAQLRWIDGKEVGIAEGDYKAATEHFLKLREQEDFQDKSDWDEEVFVYVDAASVASYMHPADASLVDLRPFGDYGGFVTAVDARFDPNDPGEHAEESPGFTGRMRILGNLLWGDLFALGKAQAASAEDLWPLAMGHPWQVYVGPVVSKQREAWARSKSTYGHDAAFERFVPQT